MKLRVVYSGVCFLMILALYGCDFIPRHAPCSIRLEPLPSPIADPHTSYESLLHNVITEDNRVDYVRFRQQEQVAAVLQACMQSPSEGDLAASLNQYNAAVLYAVWEHYPFLMVNETNCDITLASFDLSSGPRFSLGELKTTLIQQDWRTAFALAGPRRGDPPLAAEAFAADMLDEQLDRAVEGYLGSCAGLQIDHASFQVLFGELIWNRREWFIAEYERRYGTPGVSLLAAVMPWASVKTQEQLADVPGYQAALLPMDWRLNDLDRPELEQDEKDEVEFLPCGCP